MQIRFESIPSTLSEFTALPERDLGKPENTCALFLLALNLYTKNKEEGVAAMNILCGPRPLTPMGVQFIRDRLMDKAYLPMAYFEGATPQNSYTPNAPYTLEVYPDPRSQDVEEGYTRRYLRTAGADSPRSITLRRKGNEWFLWEYAGILLGIRIPANENPWA